MMPRAAGDRGSTPLAFGPTRWRQSTAWATATRGSGPAARVSPSRPLHAPNRGRSWTPLGKGGPADARGEPDRGPVGRTIQVNAATVVSTTALPSNLQTGNEDVMLCRHPTRRPGA